MDHWFQNKISFWTWSLNLKAYRREGVGPRSICGLIEEHGNSEFNICSPSVLFIRANCTSSRRWTVSSFNNHTSNVFLMCHFYWIPSNWIILQGHALLSNLTQLALVFWPFVWPRNPQTTSRMVLGHFCLGSRCMKMYLRIGIGKLRFSQTLEMSSLISLWWWNLQAGFIWPRC